MSDVFKINSRLITLDEIQFERSTFSEAMISTAVIESAHTSLSKDNSWIDVNI